MSLLTRSLYDKIDLDEYTVQLSYLVRFDGLNLDSKIMKQNVVSSQ